MIENLPIGERTVVNCNRLILLYKIRVTALIEEYLDDDRISCIPAVHNVLDNGEV